MSMSATRFMEFIGQCLVRPRQAVRTAADVGSPWAVVVLSVSIAGLVSGISSWLRLRQELDPQQFTFTGPGNALGEAGIDVAISFVIGIISFPLTLFLWNRLMGHRAQSTGVLQRPSPVLLWV